VLGWDAAREIRGWHEPRRALDLARLIVLSRPGLPSPSAGDLWAAGLDPQDVLLCSEQTPDIKATDVRALAAAGEPLDGLVPASVARYIAGRGLYRGVDRE